MQAASVYRHGDGQHRGNAVPFARPAAVVVRSDTAPARVAADSRARCRHRHEFGLEASEIRECLLPVHASVNESSAMIAR